MKKVIICLMVYVSLVIICQASPLIEVYRDPEPNKIKMPTADMFSYSFEFVKIKVRDYDAEFKVKEYIPNIMLSGNIVK